MPAKVLTDRFCESAKPGRDTETGEALQVAYPDAKVRGLELRVSPQLRRVWSFRYRVKDGRQRRLTLGIYPAMDLATARERAIQTLAQITEGKDPAVEKRREAEAAKLEPIKTVGDLAARYFTECEEKRWKPKGRPKRASTIEDERRIYRVHIEPVWKTTSIDEIDRRTIRELLRSIANKGFGIRANRAHALVRQMLAFAVAEERLEFNPAIGLAKIAEETKRERVLSDEEVKALWTALKDPSDLKWPPESPRSGETIYLSRRMAIVIQLALLTLQRRSEIAGMRMAELDLDQGTWFLPAERCKSGRPHMVALSPAVVMLIKEAVKLCQDDLDSDDADAPPPPVDYIFPGNHSSKKPLRGDSVTHSFAAVVKALGWKERTTIHDLRRTGSTALTSERIGVSHFIRSQILGHANAGGGAQVSADHYDRNTYLKEKRAGLVAWANLLLSIVGDVPRTSNVHDLHPAAVA